jgi:hypothetical protein
MLSFFHLNRKKNSTLKKRGAYAVVTGDYIGEFLVYMESDSTNNIFLSLPKMIIRKVPIDAFNRGVESNIVDLVKVLPSDVFSVCRAQYHKLKGIK